MVTGPVSFNHINYKEVTLMKDIILAIFTIVIILSIIFTGVYWFKSNRCEVQAVSFQDSNFTVFGGCMVNHKGKWLPLDNIRGFDDKG